MSNTLERAARAAWINWTVDRRFGYCHACAHRRYVGRSARSRWYCFACWDLLPPGRRNSSRQP